MEIRPDGAPAHQRLGRRPERAQGRRSAGFATVSDARSIDSVWRKNISMGTGSSSTINIGTNGGVVIRPLALRSQSDHTGTRVG